MRNEIEILLEKINTGYDKLEILNNFNSETESIQTELDSLYYSLDSKLVHLEILQKWLNNEISNEIYIKWLTDEEFEI